MHKFGKTIGVAALLAAAISTSADAQAPAGVFGVYDPATRVFQPVQVGTVAPAPGAIEPQAASSRVGKIHFRLIIKVLSGSPAATLPNCSMSFSHQGSSNHSYSEGQGIQGTRVGNNALCDLTILYSWPEANTANPVNLSFFLSVGNRSHSESLPAIPLPADGATTNVTVQVRS
jgi:hypothetical protein